MWKFQCPIESSYSNITCNIKTIYKIFKLLRLNVRKVIRDVSCFDSSSIRDRIETSFTDKRYIYRERISSEAECLLDKCEVLSPTLENTVSYIYTYI